MRFPYPSFRRGQLEAVEFVKSGLGGCLALRAPTGFGKTLVALMGHAGRGRVLYVVRTRNEISPVVREARGLGMPFTLVFSGRKMCPLLRGAEVPPEDFWLNCRLLRLKSMCPYFANLRRVSEGELAEHLERSGETDPHRLAVSIARAFSACPFFALTGLVERVGLVVATYPFFFNESVYSLAFPDVDIDQFYVVVDEAHTLVSPQSVLSDHVDLSTLRGCSGELSRIGYADLAQRVKRMEELLSRVDSRWLVRVSKLEAGVDRELAVGLEEVLQEVRLKALSSLRRVRVEEFMKVSSPVSRVARFLALASRGAFSLYAQASGDVRRLHALPLGYEPIRERLRLPRGVLLMSGTLPPERVLEGVVGRATRYLDVESSYGPVFPRENVFYAVYTPVTTSYPLRSAGMFAEYARLVRSVYESVGGAVLAVYPSYEVMSEVVAQLGGLESLYVERGDTRVGEVAERLSRSPHTLVNAVAGGKIVEGVEFRSRSGVSLISSVVVCGVPYPYPDDYVEDFRRAVRSELGEEAGSLVMDSQAAIRTAQAYGRAIRSERDRAFIVLADRRYLKKKFKELLGIEYDAVFSDLRSLLDRLEEFLGSHRPE